MKYSGSVLFAIFNFVSGILSVLLCKLLNYIHFRLSPIRSKAAQGKTSNKFNQIIKSIQREN